MGGGILFCLLFSYLFGFYSNIESHNWDISSENYVWGRICTAKKEGIFSNQMLLGNYTEDDRYYYMASLGEEGEYQPYSAQSGLQGVMFSLVAVVAGKIGIANGTCSSLLLLLNSTCFVVTLGLFSWWIAQEWGESAGIGAFSCIFLAPWIVKSMTNLYWVTWTLLLPTVVTAFWGRFIEKNKEKYGRTWGIALFAVNLVRFMCGFEYTSTVMLSSMMPLLWYLVKEWKERKYRIRWIKVTVAAGLLELGAFIVAVGILLAQLLFLHEGNFAAAFGDFASHIATRTGMLTDAAAAKVLHLYDIPLTRIETVGMYLFSTQKIYASLDMKQLLLFVGLIELIHSIEEKDFWKKGLSQTAFLLACLLPAVSWHFLVPGHSYYHQHLSYFLWCFPFLPLAVGICVQNMMEIIKALKDL